MKVDPKVSPSVKSGKVMAGKAHLKLDGAVTDGRVNPMRDIPGHKWERSFESGRIEKHKEGPELEKAGFNKVEQCFYTDFCEPGHMQMDEKRAMAKKMKGKGGY